MQAIDPRKSDIADKAGSHSYRLGISVTGSVFEFLAAYSRNMTPIWSPGTLLVGETMICRCFNLRSPELG